MSTVSCEGFQVCMYVSQFKPSEFTMKTVNTTIVHKYTLQKDHDVKWCPLNHLIGWRTHRKGITTPSKALKNERVVQIRQVRSKMALILVKGWHCLINFNLSVELTFLLYSFLTRKKTCISIEKNWNRKFTILKIHLYKEKGL